MARKNNWDRAGDRLERDVSRDVSKGLGGLIERGVNGVFGNGFKTDREVRQEERQQQREEREAAREARRESQRAEREERRNPGRRDREEDQEPRRESRRPDQPQPQTASDTKPAVTKPEDSGVRTYPVPDQPKIEVRELPPSEAQPPTAVVPQKVELEVQQQQAYLKVLGYDTGKLDGDDGPKTTGARDKFAKDNGIDPHDRNAINAALAEKMKDPANINGFVGRVQESITAGRAGLDDVKALQWTMVAQSGQNAETVMPKSYNERTGMMDGIAKSETKETLASTFGRGATGESASRVAATEAGLPTPQQMEWQSNGVERDIGSRTPSVNGPSVQQMSV